MGAMKETNCTDSELVRERNLTERAITIDDKFL